MATLFKACSSLNIVKNFLKPRISITNAVPCRGKRIKNPPPQKKYPPWLPKQHRALTKEEVTRDNIEFVREVIESKFGPRDIGLGMTTSHNSPLKIQPIEPQTEWTQASRRTGVIAKKIGIYPMWLKNGKKVLATLLQVVDNHVIKYISPENYNPMIKRRGTAKRSFGCLVVGAEGTDPQRFTKEYCGMFTESGVMPKKLLSRFTITADAALQPGTPLYAAHFQPGDYIDIRAKTMDRGFQGVMKRWGFHGMPASHGVTKTHRRPGNIGSGGNKARVMPGTKLPGHMGNRYRVFRGIKILRVNTKYNVIWVMGQAIPGETNSLLQIYDTVLPHRMFRKAPYFPTFFPTSQHTIPEELFADDVHPFGAPTITYQEDA